MSDPDRGLEPGVAHLHAARGELSRCPRSRDRPIRAAVPDVAGQPGERQHVQGCADRRSRSDHVVPVDGAARPAAQSDGGLGGRAGARPGRGFRGGGGADGRGARRCDRAEGDPMITNTATAERLDWPAVETALTTVTDRLPEPEPTSLPELEPPDLAACLSGPHGLDLLEIGRAAWRG